MIPVLAVALPSALVLVAGLAASAALRRRSPALRHVVLATAIGLAGLAVPMRLLLPGVPVAWPRASGSAEGVSAPGPIAAHGAGTAADPAASRAATAGSTVSTAAQWPWAGMVSAAWGAGALVALGLLAAACLRLRRVTAAGTPIVDARWQAVLDGLATGGRRGTRVHVVAVRERDLVATWGWRAPVILVPDTALAWDEPRLRAVLAHELAHVTRGDWLAQLVAEVVRASLWWNPLAWLACRRLREESERAADDTVLGTGLDPRAYASQLVAIARASSQPHSWTTAMAMARPSTLERRIVAMLNPHLDRAVPSRRTRLAAVACLATITLSATLLRGAQGTQPLEGVVYDVTGAVMPGVTVTLGTGDAALESTTDAAGRFTFPAVEAGRHVLQARVPGFKKLQENIELRAAGDWDRTLTLLVGEVQETIAVRASRGGATAPAAGPAPVRVGGNIRPPRKLVDVKPVYPETMRAAGREGAVRLEAIIGVDGRVSAVRVSSTPHPDFALAAADAVRRWRFAPTLLNGAAVEVVMSVSISFDLDAA